MGRDTFNKRDWINHDLEGKQQDTISVFARILATLYFTFVPIQGNTEGDLVELELMGHVATLFDRKQFLVHRGCKNQLEVHLRGGRSSKVTWEAEKGDRLYSSLHWIPGDRRLEEEFQGDLSKPRNSTVQDRVETRSGRRLVGFIWPRHEKKV